MTPIALVQIEPALVVTRNDSPYKTLGDFIAAAKESRASSSSPAARSHRARTWCGNC